MYMVLTITVGLEYIQLRYLSVWA